MTERMELYRIRNDLCGLILVLAPARERGCLFERRDGQYYTCCPCQHVPGPSWEYKFWGWTGDDNFERVW